MKYELVILDEFSGDEATIYSLIPEGEGEPLFEKFIHEYQNTYRDEVKDLVNRLYQIGHTTGARISFFKPHEGKPGDFVHALFDQPDKHLRLYCMRMGTTVVILGGGGPKPGGIKAWQEDPKLKKEAETMMVYAQSILQRIEDGDLYWSQEKLDGHFKNEEDETDESPEIS